MKKKNRKKIRKPGKVWLIGAGPGAPDLLTLRARKALNHAEVILYDDLVNPSVLPSPAHSTTFIPVGKRGGRGTPQISIEREMIRHAKLGKSVARLKGGDPFIFGRGGEEAEALRKARISYEVIPGVSSATSIPTLAGIPLTHRGVAASFTVVTGHLAEGKDDREPEWDLLAHSTDTLVIMMGVATFKRIAARLIKAGKDPQTPVAVIRWGSWPMEHRQIGTLADGEAGKLPVGTPSVIVIGEVVRQASRRHPELNPLAGVRIAVTREREFPDPLMTSIENQGGMVSETPAIRISQLAWEGSLHQRRLAANLLRSAGRYDWVIFTSGNALTGVVNLARRMGVPFREMWKPKIAVIGSETARRISWMIAPPDLIATEHRQEGLVRALGNVSGKRIMFPCATNARAYLVDTLRRRGAHIDVLPVYRTLANVGGLRRLVTLVRSDHVEVITFTSGSIVRNVLQAIGPSGRRKLADRRILAASIGPVTSAELRKHGIRPPIEARKASMEELVSSIARYYAKHPHAPRLV